KNKKINNAKWYYYSYAVDQKVYCKDTIAIEPLACDIKVDGIKNINDTTIIYFSLYRKDTLSTCILKPLGLVGIEVINDKLYRPIYHSIEFEDESDSIILRDMKKNDSLLRRKISEHKGVINQWLVEEGKNLQLPAN
ncbi:MAG TPA: hypothetical protein VET23_04265, partial [Chitinophagaceae bacterium]|nr:hypothetical protein [Chitinophagaceae bacterium]